MDEKDLLIIKRYTATSKRNQKVAINGILLL